MNQKVFLIVLLGALNACQVQDDQGNHRERTNLYKDLLHELMIMWESGDTLNTGQIFTQDCNYVDVANNHTFSGIEGVNKYVAHIHSWASDVRMEIRKMNVSSSSGYVEWTLTAKHTRPIEGRVPIATDKEFILQGATLADFKNNRIFKASDYMDVLGFVIQLGSKIELPGGVTIGG